MNKDFNVYKWRREQLIESEMSKMSPDELLKLFKEKTGIKGEIRHRTDKNAFIVNLRNIPAGMDEKMIKDLFEKNGYTYSRDEFEDEDRPTQIWYYYR
jgi:hypothetical protein